MNLADALPVIAVKMRYNDAVELSLEEGTFRARRFAKYTAKGGLWTAMLVAMNKIAVAGAVARFNVFSKPLS